MTKPAFIVEGQQEKLIVQELCPGRPVRLLGVNGKFVSYSKIASMIDNKLVSFGNRFYPIVVIFDRENRSDSSDLIIQSVCSHLQEFRSQEFIDNMIFGVPDRKIESWLMPFVDNNGSFNSNPKGEFEGKNCFGMLKKRISKKDGQYKKTKQGVSYFTQINPVELAKVSPSFANFYVKAKSINCRWILNK